MSIGRVQFRTGILPAISHVSPRCKSPKSETLAKESRVKWVWVAFNLQTKARYMTPSQDPHPSVPIGILNDSLDFRQERTKLRRRPSSNHSKASIDRVGYTSTSCLTPRNSQPASLVHTGTRAKSSGKGSSVFNLRPLSTRQTD